MPVRRYAGCQWQRPLVFCVNILRYLIPALVERIAGNNVLPVHLIKIYLLYVAAMRITRRHVLWTGR